MLLDCPVVEMSFTRSREKDFSLKPTIEYGKRDSDLGFQCNLHFWPNLELNRERDMKRFAENKWEGVVISSGVVFGRHFIMLVVQKVGKAYETVGLVWGTHSIVKFKTVSKRRIEL